MRLQSTSTKRRKIKVEPCFDPNTKTWFCTNHRAEARSLKELRQLLPKGTVIVGYTPGVHVAPPSWTPSDKPSMRTRMEPSIRRMIGSSFRPKVAASASVGELEDDFKDPGPGLGRLTRKGPRRRAKHRFDEDAILNLWIKGWGSPKIAKFLGIERSAAVRVVVQRARARGDRRAINKRHERE